MCEPIHQFRVCALSFFISFCFVTYVIAADDKYGDIKFHYGDRSSFVPAQPVAFPNIGLVGRGYDFLFANPHSTFGSDPGFRASVFDLESAMNSSGRSLSGDQRFIIPAGTSAYQDVSCSLDSETQIITSMSSYAASLQASMSANIPFEGSFSMSSDFKYAQSRMSSSRFTKSTGTCMVYSVELHETDLPPLHPYFIQEVTRVANLPQPSLGIPSLISHFGTHYITQAKMGSRFGQQSEVSAKYFNSQTSVSLKASASASFEIASVSASFSASYDQADSFSSNCTSQSLYTVGSLPPTNGNLDTWASQSIVTPEVIGIQGLQLISTLLTLSNFPHLDNGSLSVMSSTFNNKMVVYCDSTTGATCSLSEETKTDNCFGGWYSPQANPTNTKPLLNIFTGAQNCPAGYTPLGLYLPSTSTPTTGGMFDLVFCVSNNADDCDLGSSPGTGSTSFAGMYVEAESGCISSPYPSSADCKCPGGTTPITIHDATYFDLNVCLYPQSAGGAGFGIGGGFQIGNSIAALNTWGPIKSQACEAFYAPYSFIQPSSTSESNSYICLRTDNPAYEAFNLPAPMD
jgi:hypothetical protein